MRIRKWLRLADDRVLVEQLALILGNVVNSLIPALILAGLLVWTLSNDANSTALMMWGAAAALAKLCSSLYAQHLRRTDILPAHATRIVVALMIFLAVEGVAWGSLGWAALDGASVGGSIFVIATAAAIAGSSLSAFSPILPVYLVFSASVMLTLASKLLLMDDTAFRAIGLMAALYAPLLYLQARDSSAAARAAIELRFENLELIEELRREKESAQLAHREADMANLSKSKFLAAASHDLRQPIHAQGLFLEILARSGLSEQQSAILASARSASEASADMLNTLLDFSRIEAGVIEPQVRPFHLQPLLNKIENDLAPQADAKGLIYRSRETHAAVESDPALVDLIVRNLVSNAIRYTKCGGVLVACRARGDHISVEVWDTGVGIDTSHRQEIFREFHQLGNPERDRSKGLGLGLSIADGLTRALGHELSVESKRGRGSVFRLLLPVARAAVACDDMEVAHNYSHALDLRVLLIDDDESVRAAMSQLLRNWGCACIAVESIDEALASARDYRPDIVISDYRLRDHRTGAEAVAVLRAELGAALPALLVTGDTAPDRLREARASGVPLLHKPVSPSMLYARLSSMQSEMKCEGNERVSPTQ